MRGTLRLLCIQKQPQMALIAWTVQENKLIKIHRQQSVRKNFLDCWRTVSEAGMIWRDEIPCQVLYNNMENAVLTDTELANTRLVCKTIFFFYPVRLLVLQNVIYIRWLVLAQLIWRFNSSETFINMSYLMWIGKRPGKKSELQLGKQPLGRKASGTLQSPKWNMKYSMVAKQMLIIVQSIK